MKNLLPKSPQWWHCFALLVGLLVVIGSFVTPAVAVDQDDNPTISEPLVAIGRLRANWWMSTLNQGPVKFVSRIAPTSAGMHIRSDADNTFLSHLVAGFILSLSCSLRC